MRHRQWTVLPPSARRTLLLACAVLSFAALVTSSSDAFAQEEDERAETRVVQRRKFLLGHEFFAAAGWLPLDAFEKGLTASAGYALHFTDQLSIEGAFTKSIVYNTALRDELLSLGEVEPDSFRIVDYYASGTINWSPFYGKLAIDSGSLVHLGFALSVGGGYGWFPTTSRPLFLWGLGLRMYLSEALSARLDVKSLHFVETSGWDLHNEVQISLGIAVSLGG